MTKRELANEILDLRIRHHLTANVVINRKRWINDICRTMDKSELEFYLNSIKEEVRA